MDKAMHITEVCKMLGITSRTIRYYEQLGLVKTVRESDTAPRRIDSANIEALEKIVFLRKVGLTLDEISEIVRDGANATDVIMRRRKELNDEMSELISRATLLQEVLIAAEKGKDIFALIPRLTAPEASEELCRTAAEIVDLLVEGRYADLDPYYADKVRSYASEELIRSNWEMATGGLGKFESFIRQWVRGTVVHNYLRYENRDLVVCLGFNEGKLCVIFFNGGEAKD